MNPSLKEQYAELLKLRIAVLDAHLRRIGTVDEARVRAADTKGLQGVPGEA
jgi:hypothetical protein